MHNHYKHGDFNAICDRCGFEYKGSELREEWTGLRVCSSCWEPRHPQTLLKTPQEDSSLPWTRPEQDDVFIAEPTYTFDFSASPTTGQYSIGSQITVTSIPTGLANSTLPTSFVWQFYNNDTGVTRTTTTTSAAPFIWGFSTGTHSITLTVYSGDTVLDTVVKNFYIQVIDGA